MKLMVFRHLCETRFRVVSRWLFVGVHLHDNAPAVPIFFLKGEKIFMLFWVFPFVDWCDSMVELSVKSNSVKAFLALQWEERFMFALLTGECLEIHVLKSSSFLRLRLRSGKFFERMCDVPLEKEGAVIFILWIGQGVWGYVDWFLSPSVLNDCNSFSIL